MNALIEELRLNENDTDGAIARMAANEDAYLQFVREFPLDPSMDALEIALNTQDWDGAFTAVHALKGLAGNLGFVPLAHTLGELVIIIRSGRINDIKDAFLGVKRYYTSIITTINSHKNS